MSVLKNLPIGWKLFVINFVLIATVAVASTLTLKSMYSVMVDERIGKLRALIDASVNVADSLKQRSDAGEFSADEALLRWRNTTRAMVYEDVEYLFASHFDGISLVHIRTDIEGKDLSGLKDPTGFPIVQEMIRVAREEANGGRVDYLWPKVKDGDPVQKVTWIQRVPAFDVYVGTGVYVDDLDAAFQEQVFKVLIVVAVLTGLAILLSYLVSRDVAGSMRLVSGVMEKMGAGDLSVEVPEQKRKDEIGAMTRSLDILRSSALEAETLRDEQAAMKARAAEQREDELSRIANQFQNTIEEVVGKVSGTAEDVRGASSEMADMASATRDQAQMASSATEVSAANVSTVAAATEELIASIQEIGRQTSTAREVSQEAVGATERSAETVQGLVDAASKIGDVLGLISEIAEQTNLLALNATIEAARAGEAGKGFAVVASEVKALAQQTQRATDDINTHIEGIRKAVGDAAGEMKDIRNVINNVSESATAISAAIEEQSAATQEIVRNVQEASQGTQQVSTNVATVSESAGKAGSVAQTLLSSANDLSRDSETLNQKVGEFLSSLKAG